MPVWPCADQLADKFIQTVGDRYLPTDYAQAIAQQVFQAHRTEATQAGQPCRIAIDDHRPVGGRQVIEQFTRLAEVGRRTPQRRFGARKPLAEHRHYFMTQEITGKSPIAIALILDPTQIMRPSIGFDIGTALGKKRSQQAPAAMPAFDRHRRGTGDPTTTQQIEQQRFRLIAAMLSKEETICRDFGKGGIARPAGSRLQPFPRLVGNGHPADKQRHAERLAICLAECRPAIGIGRKTMVDMQGTQTAGQLEATKQMQQDHGIAAAGEPNADGFVRWQAVANEGGEPRQQVRRRPVP